MRGFFFVLVVVACHAPATPHVTLAPVIAVQPAPLDAPSVRNDDIEVVATNIRDAIVARDMPRFARFVHPTRGVRFSPYAYVDPKVDVVLDARSLVTAFPSPETRTWGAYDGSGEPIDLSFAEYMDHFVAFSELAHIKPALNETSGSGNTTNNLADVYPAAPYVEFHFAGTQAREQMDWESLRLVFQRDRGGELFLIGIIHDQWTI